VSMTSVAMAGSLTEELRTGADCEVFQPLTERAYWEVYHRLELPQVPMLSPDKLGEVHRLLERYLPEGRARLVEMGAAPGRFLGYFHRYFGYDVTGVDNSPAGVRTMVDNMARWGIGGEVVVQDVFEYCGGAKRFDVVASFGFIEHFVDWPGVVSALGSILAPGGVMVTSIPNMRGVNGLICRSMRPHVYRAHVPIALRPLVAAHRRAGLSTLWAGYYGGCVLNPLVNQADLVRWSWQAVWRINALTRAFNGAASRYEQVRGVRYAGETFSPRVMVIARRGS